FAVIGKREDIRPCDNNQLCRMQARLRSFGEMFTPSRAGIAEAVVVPNSRWVEQLVGDLRMRKRFGISVLAVTRGEQVFREDVREVSLRPGDTFIIHGLWSDLTPAAESRDFVAGTDLPPE